MTIDERHVFHSTDFLPGMPLVGAKLSNYANIFERASTIEFKPRILVDCEPQMHQMHLTNYEEYMYYVFHGQPQLRQRRALRNADLRLHRQRLRAAMEEYMLPRRAAREQYMERPQTVQERYLTGFCQTVTFDRAGEIATFRQNVHNLNAGSVYIVFLQCMTFASVQNCHVSTQNLDWEVTINGQYRMREIDFKEPEPGQLPVIFDDYPHIFTSPVTMLRTPRFLARHRRDMAKLQCTNYHLYRLYLKDVEKMKEFLFIEFSGRHKMEDVFPQILDALVASRRANIL